VQRCSLSALPARLWPSFCITCSLSPFIRTWDWSGMMQSAVDTLCSLLGQFKPAARMRGLLRPKWFRLRPSSNVISVAVVRVGPTLLSFRHLACHLPF
jgi:hypothetical protein